MGEYYAPRAKKRWCLSLYNNVGQHALGVFPQAAMVGYCIFQLDPLLGFSAGLSSYIISFFHNLGCLAL